jgi:16S rRNA processing protein RimM
MPNDSLIEKLKKSNPEGAYRAVGRVKDAHGLKGEIWVVLFAGLADWLDSLRQTGGFLLASDEGVSSEEDLKTGVSSFSLKAARVHKNGLILQSPDIADRTSAEKLKGKFLIIPDNYLESDEGEEFYLSEVEGFRVFEGEQLLGIVTGFSSNVAQDLLVVSLESSARPGVKKGSEIEIPFVEAIVVGVSGEEQKLEVSLPEGLIEVQLGLDQSEDEAETEPEESDVFGDDDEFESEEKN